MKFSINCMRLRKLFEKISKMTDECVLDFKPTGLKAEVVDKGMVCLGIFNISRDSFSSYDSISKGEICSVNVTKMLKVLRRINGQNDVSLDLTESKIKIKQDGRVFTLSQIEVEKEELPSLKELEFDVKVKFSSEEYTKCLKDATIFSTSSEYTEDDTSMVFNSKGNKLYLTAEDEVDSWKADYDAIPKNPEAGQSYGYALKSIKGEGKAKYPLDWLLKSKPKSDWGVELDMRWKEERPIEIKYSEEGIKCKYIIAPRVSDEE